MLIFTNLLICSKISNLIVEFGNFGTIELAIINLRSALIDILGFMAFVIKAGPLFLRESLATLEGFLFAKALNILLNELWYIEVPDFDVSKLIPIITGLVVVATILGSGLAAFTKIMAIAAEMALVALLIEKAMDAL